VRSRGPLACENLLQDFHQVDNPGGTAVGNFRFDDVFYENGWMAPRYFLRLFSIRLRYLGSS
jgi:hypothetical protein